MRGGYFCCNTHNFFLKSRSWIIMQQRSAVVSVIGVIVCLPCVVCSSVHAQGDPSKAEIPSPSCGFSTGAWLGRSGGGSSPAVR